MSGSVLLERWFVLAGPFGTCQVHSFEALHYCISTNTSCPDEKVQLMVRMQPVHHEETVAIGEDVFVVDGTLQRVMDGWIEHGQEMDVVYECMVMSRATVKCLCHVQVLASSDGDALDNVFWDEATLVLNGI
jgi:hypothetical protein